MKELADGNHAIRRSRMNPLRIMILFKKLFPTPLVAGSAIIASGLLAGCVSQGYYETSGPVPEDYTWDGYEYVGFVGGEYYYLGPRHVWIVCEPYRLERFHGWEREHGDWRTHAIHNDHYRNIRREQEPARQEIREEPRHEQHEGQPATRDGHEHERDGKEKRD